MKALDTNVLARFFIDDPEDPQAAVQRPAATAALSQKTYVGITVLLEFEWVMRGFYELPKKDVVRVLRALASIESLTLEDRPAVMAALDALEKGLDFADALHLARSARTAALVTFDKKLQKKSKALGWLTPVELLA